MLSQKTKERLGAAVGAAAFLALFGGMGGLGLWFTGNAIYDGLRAGDWAPVEAEIKHADAGTATYSYWWQERRYVSDRVGTFAPGGRTDLDDWDEHMDKLLSDAVAEKKPVTAYVNPRDPEEALLDRQIRWKFLLVIMGLSLASAAGGLTAFVAIGRDAIGWQSRGAGVPLLKPRAREALFQWAVGVVWSGTSFPIAIVAMPEMWDKGEWFPVILLAIFPFFGLLILWSAVSSTLATFREGSPFNARTAA
jgi:hypothetical protein